jgi:hypothetical protein
LNRREEMAEFNVGDMVKIVRKASGVNTNWVPPMDKYIGRIGTVEDISHSPDADYLVEVDGDSWWYVPDSLSHAEGPVKAVPQQHPWHEVALHLADFTYSDGSKISWRQVAEMIGVPRTTVSDFLRKTLKGA